jgi:hypothetical protein
VKVQYIGCTAFALKAEVSEAEYEFNSNGLVSVLNSIVVTIPSLACSIKIAPTSNKNLSTVKYENHGANIIETSEVTGITYASSGGFCGSSGTSGEYTGSSEIELEGGTIEVV